ncbi:MAG: 16S rRNA (cytidine(1402)-2'-O)-methyltransferase [Eubacteriales bacterium]|jgi:16S rRNA (cytidine1402-2'-O)-methyltransferase
MPGTLYVVSTPIGNLGDMTPRALEVLKSVDFVAAEDTRVAMKLLGCFGIQKPLVSYFEHNKRARGDVILARIAAGENCALTTDAGTPTISDPGAELVAQCREKGIPVVTVPGACAAVAAFSLAGLRGARFTFEGFLSVSKPSRRAHLQSLVNETRPMIFYEAPHKLRATLADFRDTFGEDRVLFIARELTKLHEESFRTTIGGAIERYEQTEPRGEYVLIVAGGSEPETPPVDAVAAARARVAEGMSPSEAVRVTSRETNMPRNAIYKALLEDAEP